MNPVQAMLAPNNNLCGWPPIVQSSTQSDELTAQLEIGAELPYFDGHFDGRPVLPGVVQTHWAAQLAQTWCATKSARCELRAVKFYHLVVPGTVLELHLHRSAGNGVPGRETVQFHYRALCSEKHGPAGQAVSQGKLIFHS